MSEECGLRIRRAVRSHLNWATVRAGLVDSQVRAHPTIAVRDDVGDEGRNALP
jgi:hypothetical protein